MNTVKIIISDEVNVRLDGISPADRRELVRLFEFEIPGAKYTPAVKLGRWNGKTSYFSIGGNTYINLLDQILPILMNKGYDFELIDERDYNRVFEFNQIKEDTFSDKVWPPGHPVAGEPVILRDYQVAAVNQKLQNTQGISVLATGSGKSLIIASLSLMVQDHGRSIVIVPNKSLIAQTEVDYVNLGLDVGVYYGDRKETGKKHIICTWQSVHNLIKSTEEGTSDYTIDEFLKDVVCVIVDEVHQVAAKSLKDMLAGPMSKIPIRWGLTGTLPKEKYAHTALYCCIGNTLGSLQASELQEKGVLAGCHVNIIQTQENNFFSDYQKELKFITTNKERITYVANEINSLAKDGNTLVLIDRVETGKLLLDLLPDSVFINGSTKAMERKKQYDEISEVDNRIIIATYGVASTGISIARLFNVVLMDSGKSFTKIIQSIGRGLRKASDKDHVEIYDICSNCRFSKRHLAKRKEYYKEAKYEFSIRKVNY
jgi:superfamily II DNA or RNA helicase